MHVDLTILLTDADGRLATVGEGTAADPIRLPCIGLELDLEDRALPPAREAIAARFGVTISVLELFAPDGVDDMDPAPVLIVLEPLARTAAGSRSLNWQPSDRLDQKTIHKDLRDRAATWLAEWITDAPVPALRAAWSRPGWHARLTEWLDRTLRDAGRTRTGPVEQMRLWGISALLRAESDRGAVWVKAAYPHFAAEPQITRFLAGRFPDAVPQVLGSNDAEGWLAMADLGADEVGEWRAEPIAHDAVRLLARMQRQLAADTWRLQDAGAQVHPLDRLADDVAAVFAADPPDVPWTLSEARRTVLVEQVRVDADEIASLGIAESLVHGDFHPWNVAVVDGRPVIFDWTDAAIAHPLVDFAAWVGYVASPDQRPVYWRAWVEAWSDVVPEASLAPRYHQVLALGSAYQVVSYAGILRPLEPAARSPLAHGMLDYAALLDGAVAAREGVAFRGGAAS